MIQVIPFTADQEPLYLPLLARGLSDLSALRFNAVEIQAQVNTELGIEKIQDQLDQNIDDTDWAGQELWFTGDLEGREGLSMTFVLVDPQRKKIVYRDFFHVPEDKFLGEWERRLQKLMEFLNVKDENLLANRRMYTKSLEAFLAFRKGLEVLSQAKNDRSRDEGLEELLKAVAYDPEFIEAADILLLFLMQTDVARNFDRSVSILERLRQITNHHPRIPLVLAEVYYQWGNKEKAEQLLRELITTFPEFTEGWIRLALFYHSLDRQDEALDILQGVIAFDPENATALDLIGAIYAGKGDRKQAADVWQKVLENEPSRVNILNNLALISEEDGDIDKAENYYQQAIKTNENWWGSFYYYGTFCSRRERYEEAVIWLEKSAELNTTHYLTFQNLGMAFIKLGRYADAQESLLQLLQLAPDNSTRQQTLQLISQLNNPEAKLEFRLRQLERIWDAGKKWLVLVNVLKIYFQAKKRWYYWYLIGRIFNESGFKQFQMTFWLTGLRYDPGFPLLKKTGLYYWEKGNFKKALPILRKAYQLHKSDQETVMAYLQTLINLGEVEELQANVKGLSQLTNITSRRPM